MIRRSFLKAFATAGLTTRARPAWTLPHFEDAGQAPGQASPETILLKDYRPKSLYKVPITEVPRAKYPIIDMHSHAYAKSPEEIAEWVKNMDEVGIEKTIILSGATGQEFDDVYRKYAVHPDRFELWCGFDYTGYDQSGFGPQAVRE